MRSEFNLKVIETDRHISPEEIAAEYNVVRQAMKNPAVFQTLYDRYFTRIFHFIFRRIDDEQITADLTSQTFLKALGNLRKYTFRGVPFSAWLYRIAANEVNRHYRNTRQKMVFSIDEEEFELLLSHHTTEETEELDAEYVIGQMRTMSETEIQVLELRFFENKSFAEIAYILDITEANAKMRTYRAVEKLRKLTARRES
ncbi:MAG: sigma-70 family RNA polymerase sigma factor [Cyclobacteriaceae bacterium]|nr:sigma-70 family RNA polymerase sigma factor [Cyclobacteriaceae bacterium]